MKYKLLSSADKTTITPHFVAFLLKNDIFTRFIDWVSDEQISSTGIYSLQIKNGNLYIYFSEETDAVTTKLRFG